MLLDKLFNPITLLVINAIIILLAESVGGGAFFYTSGIIHIIALLFIVLAITRVYFHYYTYDPVLEKFLHASIAALLVFGASHIVEFLSIIVLKTYQDTTFASVAQFYMASILLITVGTEIFLRKHDRRSYLFIGFLSSVIAFLFGFTAFILKNDQFISLEPDEPVVYIYMTALIAIGILGVWQMIRIKKLVPIMSGFVNYLTVAIGMVVIATIPNIFYEVMEHGLGIPEMQVTYLSHFTFYAALSVLFLAFGRLSTLGGIYKDLDEEVAKEKDQ